MSDSPPKAKIYDRPEPKGPSPMVLAIALLVVLIVGFFIYRAFVHPAGPAPAGSPGFIRLQPALWQEAVRYGTQ